MTIAVFDLPDPAGVASKANALKMAGVQAVILYISPGFPAGAKTVKKPHIDTIHAAGLAVGFVCEWWGGSENFVHHDINAAYGTRDGGFCGHYLNTLGAPEGVAVSPTVDNDASPAQLNQMCLPYFRAFRASMYGTFKMGAYGCGSLLFALEAEPAQIMDIPWLSNAMGWSRSHEYDATGRAVITQQRQTKLLGIDIDPDVVKGDLAAAEILDAVMSATPQDYQVGTAALAKVIAAAIKANVPEFLQGDVPAGLVTQIEQQGAAAVIDAVEERRKSASIAGPG